MEKVNKTISKFLRDKKKGKFDDRGNIFESFMHLTLSKHEQNKPRYLYKSSFDERRQMDLPEFKNIPKNLHTKTKNKKEIYNHTNTIDYKSISEEVKYSEYK